MAKTLAERLKEPGVQAEIQRHSAKLTAEEHGWVVMEPRYARALLAVARAARRAAADYEEEPYGIHRALARMDNVSGRKGAP